MIFSIMDVLHFFIWINPIIHVLPKVSIREVSIRKIIKILPEAPIQKFTGFHNSEYKHSADVAEVSRS